jgi:hypothetical protein
MSEFWQGFFLCGGLATLAMIGLYFFVRPKTDPDTAARLNSRCSDDEEDFELSHGQEEEECNCDSQDRCFCDLLACGICDGKIINKK